ncbi:MAG: hypothetical protein KA785_06525 [Spirochaetaceae bacterium]|jgi:hypothetical protein|nr:hypothetical protein [Spirochaetaceae bacterium]HPX25225.1 hypothetical protein [Treponemataceae bacterium]
MRAIRKLCLLCLAALLITSCATLPKEQNGKGILAVCIEADKTKSEYYYVHYRFYYDEDKFFIVDPALNKGFALNLDPGIYIIKKIEAVYNTYGDVASEVERNFPFEIKPNTITILNKKIKVWFNEKNGNLLQFWNTYDLTEKDREEVKANIAKMENGDIWTTFDF